MINAVYVKSTQEILYLRHEKEKIWSKDGSVKFTKYYTKENILNNTIPIKLSKNKLLSMILYYDWTYRNNNAKEFPDGYYGKFQLNEGSNEYFYKELIIEGFDEVWKHLEGI